MLEPLAGAALGGNIFLMPACVSTQIQRGISPMFDASAANWFGINAVCAKMQGYERIRGTV